MKNFFILGSCVTRDAFEPKFNKDFKCVKYLARTSLARLNFGNEIIEKDNINLSSKFQKDSLYGDLVNQTLSVIKNTEFDYLVLDFVDDRFGLVEFSENIFITYSDELKLSKISDFKNKIKIEPHTNSFFELWEDGLKKIINLVGAEKIIVNQVYWSEFSKSGVRLATSERVEYCNDFISKLYAIAKKYIPIKNFIDYDSSIMKGDENHKWGPSPFHYIDDLYNDFIEKLKDIVGMKNINHAGTQSIYHHANPKSFIGSIYKNGRHIIFSDKEMQVNALIENCEHITESDYIIIGFNGRIDSSGVNSEFFSYRDIAKSINKPFITFADPTLLMNKSLKVTWYAGNEYLPNLPDLLADICDGIIKLTGKKILLVGGSSGGFAALNIQSRMEKKAETISFVWNPQTDLLEFARTPVARYMSYAYPSDNVDFTRNVNDPSLDTFTYSKIDSIIKVNSENKSYIVMDGYDALHLRQHLEPYLSNEVENIIVDNNIIKLNNLSVVIGDWADGGIGHVPLPRDQAAEIIEQLMRNDYQFEKDAFFKSNRSFLNLGVHDLSDLKTIFSKVSDHLMIECDVSDKYTGYQLRYVVRKHGGDIAFRTGFVGYTSKAKSFIEINDKFPLDQLHRFSIEIEIYDFFGNVFTLSNKIIRNSMREYGVNKLWG